MSAMVSHPLRLAALACAFLLTILAGAIFDSRVDQAATKSEGGWLPAVITAVDLERDATLARGRDPWKDAAYAKELELAYDEAVDEFVASIESTPSGSDAMDQVALASWEYLTHVEQLYRTMSIRQDGTPLPDPNEGYMRDQLTKQAQLRANLHAALVGAGLDAQAITVGAPVGVEPKLPPAHEAEHDLKLSLMYD